MIPISRDQEIAKLAKTLDISIAEATEVYEYDNKVNHDEKTEFDLPPDKAKIARSYTHTGTRKQSKPLNLTKRERKPDATKGGIIAELARFLEKNSEFAITNLSIPNKERQLAFEVGEDKFELTLTRKRKPKE